MHGAGIVGIRMRNPRTNIPYGCINAKNHNLWEPNHEHKVR